MLTPELLKYVQEQKAAGATDDQLRHALSAQGWLGDDINAALNPKPVFQTGGGQPMPTPMYTSAETGKPSVPPEAKGWSWGVPSLTWIWGIKFHVWLAFITFVLNGIWWIVLGIKGREWAWQAKQWNSVDEFRAAMKPWDKWGFIIFIAVLASALLYALIVFFTAQTSSTPTT